MKRLEKIKTLQMGVFFLVAIICFYLIIINSDTYKQIVQSPNLQVLCALLWIVLFIAFLFIFIDFSVFSKQKHAFNALDYAAHSDPLARIANRAGVDEIIEKYIDQPLTGDMGVAMFLLTSLNEINRFHNRLLGNKQIRNFSIILKLASTDVCFVGRNGGNVFMAIFENAATINMSAFLERIEQKVIEYNSDKEAIPMYYTLGTATQEDGAETINGLISMAHKRAQDSSIIPKGTVTISDIMGSSDENKNLPAQVVETEIISREALAMEEKIARENGVPSFAVSAKIVVFEEDEDIAEEPVSESAEPTTEKIVSQVADEIKSEPVKKAAPATEKIVSQVADEIKPEPANVEKVEPPKAEAPKKVEAPKKPEPAEIEKVEAEPVRNPKSASSASPESSRSYSYTDDEKYGTRTAEDSYVIVSFREAV